MSLSDISILIVDDAKFSSAVINRVVENCGFNNIRHASSARLALELLDQQPADIVVADWLMPVMDGLQMTQAIRQLDEQINRYTYVLLLTAKEGIDSMCTAFAEGIDDFVRKSEMKEHLQPRLLAAERLVNNQNRLLRDNQLLIKANSKLKQLTTIDPLTGLGNRHYALRRIEATLNHTAARNGTAALLVLTITNLNELKQQHSAFAKGALTGVSRRLRQLVRPLDTVTRAGPNQFAIIAHLQKPDDCISLSKRIHNGINNKAFKTDMGYTSIKGSTTLCSVNNQQTLPEPQPLLKYLLEQASKNSDLHEPKVTTWEKSALIGN